MGSWAALLPDPALIFVGYAQVDATSPHVLVGDIPGSNMFRAVFHVHGTNELASPKAGPLFEGTPTLRRHLFAAEVLELSISRRRIQGTAQHVCPNPQVFRVHGRSVCLRDRLPTQPRGELDKGCVPQFDWHEARFIAQKVAVKSRAAEESVRCARGLRTQDVQIQSLQPGSRGLALRGPALHETSLPEVLPAVK